MRRAAPDGHRCSPEPRPPGPGARVAPRPRRDPRRVAASCARPAPCPARGCAEPRRAAAGRPPAPGPPGCRGVRRLVRARPRRRPAELSPVWSPPRRPPGDGRRPRAVTIAYVATLKHPARPDRRPRDPPTTPDATPTHPSPIAAPLRHHPRRHPLAEIGDCRDRSRTPTRSSARCAPSTRTSGRHRAVTSAGAATRNSATPSATRRRQLAGNAWAAQRYQQLRADGNTHPHATRILARTWTHIIWRCWQDHTAYDPALHGGHQRPPTGGKGTHRAAT